MAMTKHEALNILGCTAKASHDEILAAYNKRRFYLYNKIEVTPFPEQRQKYHWALAKLDAAIKALLPDYTPPFHGKESPAEVVDSLPESNIWLDLLQSLSNLTARCKNFFFAFTTAATEWRKKFFALAGESAAIGAHPEVLKVPIFTPIQHNQIKLPLINVKSIKTLEENNIAQEITNPKLQTMLFEKHINQALKENIVIRLASLAREREHMQIISPQN